MTLSAPNNLPDSVPPLRVYIANVTLCIAGLNPEPIDPSIPNSVKDNGVGARPMKV